MTDSATLQLRAHVADQLKIWPLDQASLVIGRSSRCAIHLPDGTVSKEHAEIVRTGEEWRVRDLGSRNGTRVNGREAVEPIALRAGDHLEVGQVLLEVAHEATRPQVRFNDATVMGSSLRLRADQILERRSRSGGTAELVHLLADAGRLLVRPKPLTETCDELLSFVERAVRASRYVLLLQPGPDAEPVQIAARTPGGRTSQPLALSRSIMRTVIAECTSVLTADAALDPRFQGQLSIVSQSVRSAMAVPLFDNERVLGVLYVDSQDLSIAFSEEQLELLTLIANMAAVKITNARLLEADQARARLAQELATAAEIQRGLLPLAPPRMPGWEFDAYLETCHEVGGDLYDFHRGRDGRITFVVGDVTGKGMGASLLMSSFLASARVLYDVCPGLGELSSRLGSLVFASTGARRFITGFLGRLDPSTGALEYVNAGHPAPCVVNDEGLRALESTGIPFGILPDFEYVTASTELGPGELLAIFSDGIPEAQRGEEFFEDERLREVLRQQSTTAELSRARQNVIERVEAFVDGAPRTDDITLLMVRRSR
ncbi:MAG TPA: SpoIIE family protein phosphatase [Candidatus Udaeobacter sp.]|jgi:serine phosphatase RsbU (regulator of sigma subunit)|nr:SpoIIE family protein phosphatase [Candidatus Udaeobacter sp.]